ncbi:hypothetical protein X946_4809 [Burkholderia sp. ABCPW 111]|nr:hypothetical protein X946_4809 [Burkholderia sp. ABCPW 111]
MTTVLSRAQMSGRVTQQGKAWGESRCPGLGVIDVAPVAPSAQPRRGFGV